MGPDTSLLPPGLVAGFPPWPSTKRGRNCTFGLQMSRTQWGAARAAPLFPPTHGSGPELFPTLFQPRQMPGFLRHPPILCHSLIFKYREVQRSLLSESLLFGLSEDPLHFEPVSDWGIPPGPRPASCLPALLFQSSTVHCPFSLVLRGWSRKGGDSWGLPKEGFLTSAL